MNFDKMLPWRTAAQKFPASGAEQYCAQKIGLAILDFMIENGWDGACHSTSAVFTVLLREKNIFAELCIGQCKIDTSKKPFDHSWIELDGTIYDLAIAAPLTPNAERAPVFAGKDTETLEPPTTLYGIPLTFEYDLVTQTILTASFRSYMDDSFPYRPRGLWDVCSEISQMLGKSVSAEILRDKHSDIVRVKKSSWPKRTR